MKTITEKQALELLKKYAPDNSTFQKVLQHSQTVQKAAVIIAEEIIAHGHQVDLEFIKVGSLLHDIGHFQAPPKTEKTIQHGVIGGKILRKEGLPQLAKLCEHHLGAGIDKEEIITRKLPLPAKNYFPTTLEEKIITYADKLVFKNQIAQVSEAVESFKRDIPNASALKRMIALHNEIETLRGGNNLL